MDQSFMKTRRILPLVLSMSLPMVLSMLVNSLYNIVDSMFVSKISEDAMTALSLVFPIQNTVGAVSIGFGVGVNAVVAYFLGAGKQDTADGAASLGVVLSILHSVVLTIVFELITEPFLSLFTSDPEVLDYGVRYARVVLAFTFIGQISLVYEKLFQAVGRMKITMVSMIAGCVANIILDPLMIFGIGPFPYMGIEGAAYATVIGQLLTWVIYLVLYKKGRMNLHLSLSHGVKSFSYAGRIYNVGIPAALNQGLPSLLITILNGILTGFSGSGILILGIYYKLQTFIYLSANGMIQGIRPIVGYNYGAGESKRVQSIFRTALTIAVLIMGIGTLMCLLIPNVLMGIYTQNEATIAGGCTALRIICIGFLPSAVSITVSGVLEGLGKGVPSLIVMSMRYLVVIVPAAFLLSHFMGESGVWHAFWITECIACASSALLFRTVMRKVIKNKV